MESYRMSSRLSQENREYLIQTSSDTSQNAVVSTVFVDGRQAESSSLPHPGSIAGEEILSLVKLTHNEKKREIELMLSGFRTAMQTADVTMMYHLGTAFYYKGLFDEAAAMFAAVVRINPGHHQALNYLGMTSLAIGQFEAAVDAASRAVEQRPTFADYRNNLGEACLAANLCSRAIAELQQATKINLYYGDAYFNLGLAHLQQTLTDRSGRSEDLMARVTDFMTKASLITPHYKSSSLDDGMLKLQAGDLASALNCFKQARQQKKDKHRSEFASFYMKFVLHPDLVSEKVVTDRIEYLKAELQKNPHYIDLMTELAQCYVEQSKLIWQKAIDQYRRVLQIQPSLEAPRRALERAEELFAGMVTDLEHPNVRGVR